MKKTILILAALVVLLTGNVLFAIPPYPPGGGGSVSVSDAAYNETTWDGVTDTAPSKNAVRDKFFTVDAALALKQTSHANLTSVSGLTFSEGSFVAMTGANTFALRTYAQVLSDIGAAASGHNHDGTYQAADADLTTIAALAPAENKIIVGNSTPVWSLSAYTLAAPSTSGNIMKSDGTNWTSSNSLSIATLDMTSSTSSIPCPVGTAAAPTDEGKFYWNSTNDALTVGNGAAAEEMVTLDNTQTLTNKTLDANGTGNVLKGYGYITLRRPNNRGSATTAVTTTETDINYGMPTFADDVESNNYIDYFCEVPRDIDTAVDLVAWFKFRLGGADTADHDYIISMVSIADSAAQAGTPGNAINLSYSADASGASGDVETAGGDTLTDWKSNVTAGNLWMIRITRDGDDGTNDASTVDSYPVELTIRYGWTQ